MDFFCSEDFLAPNTKCFWLSYDLFVQNIWSFQSSIWVATCQNWLPVHFSTSVHLQRLYDMAVTQRGKTLLLLLDCWLNSSDFFSLWFSLTIKARWWKRQKRKKNLWNVYDPLFITGQSMHHGDEANLPKTESKRSMCQGQRSVYFPDVRLLPVHRGRFWVVSSMLCSYSFHFIKSSAQHFITLQRQSLWSKPKAQRENRLKTCIS